MARPQPRAHDTSTVVRATRACDCVWGAHTRLAFSERASRLALPCLPRAPPPQVLYSKFGFMYTDIKLGEGEFILIREDDVIGARHHAEMTDVAHAAAGQRARVAPGPTAAPACVRPCLPPLTLLRTRVSPPARGAARRCVSARRAASLVRCG